jgi:hypothetical protein
MLRLPFVSVDVDNEVATLAAFASQSFSFLSFRMMSDNPSPFLR